MKMYEKYPSRFAGLCGVKCPAPCANTVIE